MPRKPILKYNPKLKDRARKLCSSMTDSEVKLWQHLRTKQIAGIKFLRQRPIGNYIVDFYAPEAKLIIEVNGGQHYEDNGLEYDEIRDAYLKGLNLTVLRVSNLDVLNNIEGVVERIKNEMKMNPDNFKHDDISFIVCKREKIDIVFPLE